MSKEPLDLIVYPLPGETKCCKWLIARQSTTSWTLIKCQSGTSLTPGKSQIDTPKIGWHIQEPACANKVRLHAAPVARRCSARVPDRHQWPDLRGAQVQSPWVGMNMQTQFC